MDRYGDAVEMLGRAVLGTAGSTTPELRAAAFTGMDVPGPWTDLVGKIRDSSYRVSDEDFSRLAASGCDEDAIFEIAVTAAVGAGMLRLDAGLRALSEAG